jgi:cobalt/nickel transport system permease protein
VLYLDYLAHNNALRHVSVAEKLLLGGGGLLLALVLTQPQSLLTDAAVMHVLMLYAGVPPAYLWRLWRAPLAFLLVGLVSVAVSVSVAPFDGPAVVAIGAYYCGVTAVGLAAAQALLLRSVTALSCLLFLATTTPVAHLAGYFARWPGLGTLSDIALLTYRFIFVFLATAAQIYTAQQSRLGYSGGRRSLLSLGLLAANVGRKTCLSARDLYLALSARDYRDRLAVAYQSPPVRPLRLVAVAATLAAIALTAFI